LAKCDVCNREGSDVTEYPSTLGRKTTNYCLDCILSNREPYDELVDFGWEYGMFNKPYQQKVLLPSIIFAGKDVRQFNEDVRKKRDEQNDSISTQQ
jgi:hypothetical protein